MGKHGDSGSNRQTGAPLGRPPGADAAIPDKLYFRIGEVATLCRVPTYVLRFWQSEFPQLRPGKSGTGQRLYRKRDVETALRIKRLLHEDGYTIAGARGVLAEEAAIPAHLRLQPALPLAAPASPSPETNPTREVLQHKLRQVRQGLHELLQLLEPRRAPLTTHAPSQLLLGEAAASPRESSADAALAARSGQQTPGDPEAR